MSARARAHPWWRQETASERDARLHAEQEAMWAAERVERLRKPPAGGVRESPAFEYGMRATVGVIDPYPVIEPRPLCPDGEHEMEECAFERPAPDPIYRCIKCRHYFVEESEGGTK